MKKAVMEKWTKELTSGRYRQIDGALKKPRGNKAYGHCCLGVLCDIYARETGKGLWEGEAGSNKSFVVGTSRDDGTLPSAVRKWAGMKDSSGRAGCTLGKIVDDDGDERTAESLVELNDDLNFKFPQIAQVIRKNYKKL